MRQAVVLEPMMLSEPHATIPHSGLTVAEAVWMGTALLHDKRPYQDVFTVDEILESVLNHKLSDAPIETIKQHVKQHCVANLPPRPNRSRMLYMTGPSHRRLFRNGDRFDDQREGAPTHPAWEKLPSHVHEWYETVWNSPSALIANDPLLNAIGTGKGMFGDQGADAYVDSLRDGWDDPR